MADEIITDTPKANPSSVLVRPDKKQAAPSQADAAQEKRPKTMMLAKDLAIAYTASMDALLDGVTHHMASPFIDLDRKIPAWLHEGHLVVVAGRPAMGKSVFGQMIGEHVAEQGKTSILFTLEMSNYEITERSISRRSGVSIPRLKVVESLGKQDWQVICAAIAEFEKIPFLVDDASFDVDSLVHKAKAAAAGLVKAGLPPLGCIVVDYIQLVGGKGANRNLEITQVTGALKRMAKELSVPVIALSQLNRAVEGRSDKRPTLSDLRESGAIEQDADLVLFLYRDEYYTKEACKEPGVAEVISAKNRHGATGVAKLAFLGERVMFANLSIDHAGRS